MGISNSVPPDDFRYTREEAEYVTPEHNGCPVRSQLPDEANAHDSTPTHYENLLISTNGDVTPVPLLHVAGVWNVSQPSLQLAPVPKGDAAPATAHIEFVKRSDDPDIPANTWAYEVAFDKDGRWPIPNRAMFVAFRDCLVKLDVRMSMHTPAPAPPFTVTMSSQLDRGCEPTPTGAAATGDTQGGMELVGYIPGTSVRVMIPKRLGKVAGEEEGDEEEEGKV